MYESSKSSEDVQRRLAWLDAILDSATEVSLLGRIVRNPALAPKSVADLLAKSDEAQIQRQNVEKFSRSVAGMIDLVGSILDLSNIESGLFELEKTDFELQTVVEQALVKVRARAHAKRISLRFNLDPEIPKTLLGDPLRLSDLIGNLVGNAILHTDSGEIIVAAQRDPANQTRVHFSVSGSGIKINYQNPETIHADCVDPDRSASCRPGKAGMGLGFCHLLAQQMGSGLLIRPNSAGDSSFSFDVLFPEKVIPAESLTPREVNQTQSASILVAEDSEDCRYLLQEFLRAGGFTLTFVENGKQALEIARSQHFDLILMDIQMPVMDGLTATRLIRESELQSGRTAVPILALTPNSRKTDIELSHAAGCTAHVRKPVSKLHLLNTIQQHLPSHTNLPALADVEVTIPEGLEEAAQHYIMSRKNDMPRLQSLIEAKDFEQLRILANNLKGTGKSFGFPVVTKIAGQMESSAQEKNVAELSAQLHALNRYIGAAADILNPCTA